LFSLASQLHSGLLQQLVAIGDFSSIDFSFLLELNGSLVEQPLKLLHLRFEHVTQLVDLTLFSAGVLFEHGGENIGMLDHQ